VRGGGEGLPLPGPVDGGEQSDAALGNMLEALTNQMLP
jgi:hypothetical protein